MSAIIATKRLSKITISADSKFFDSSFAIAFCSMGEVSYNTIGTALQGKKYKNGESFSVGF